MREDVQGVFRLARYNVETNLWQEIRAGGRPPPARSGAQALGSVGASIFHRNSSARLWSGLGLCGFLVATPRRTLAASAGI